MFLENWGRGEHVFVLGKWEGKKNKNKIGNGQNCYNGPDVKEGKKRFQPFLDKQSSY